MHRDRWVSLLLRLLSRPHALLLVLRRAAPCLALLPSRSLWWQLPPTLWPHTVPPHHASGEQLSSRRVYSCMWAELFGSIHRPRPECLQLPGLVGDGLGAST